VLVAALVINIVLLVVAERAAERGGTHDDRTTPNQEPGAVPHLDDARAAGSPVLLSPDMLVREPR
jgi:hypothetical protein